MMFRGSSERYSLEKAKKVLAFVRGMDYDGNENVRLAETVGDHGGAREGRMPAAWAP